MTINSPGCILEFGFLNLLKRHPLTATSRLYFSERPWELSGLPFYKTGLALTNFISMYFLIFFSRPTAATLYNQKIFFWVSSCARACKPMFCQNRCSPFWVYCNLYLQEHVVWSYNIQFLLILLIYCRKETYLSTFNLYDWNLHLLIRLTALRERYLSGIFCAESCSWWGWLISQIYNL